MKKIENVNPKISESNKRISIEFNGWITVAKEDLKIQSTEGECESIDTTELSEKEVVSLLSNGKAVLESFGETYCGYALDGEESFDYNVEED